MKTKGEFQEKKNRERPREVFRAKKETEARGVEKEKKKIATEKERFEWPRVGKSEREKQKGAASSTVEK